jgi:hypothetical protein
MGKYTHTKNDSWSWTLATPQDVPDIVKLVDTNYSQEIEDIIFTKNPTRLHYHLHKAIVDQVYGLSIQNISIARDKDSQKLLAWAWIERGKYTVYSDEEMAVAEFSHVDLELPLRTRMTLVAQTLEIWISWCELNNIPVLCSTSIREDQAGFMRLHDQFGFVRRGSFAYRKIL